MKDFNVTRIVMIESYIFLYNFSVVTILMAAVKQKILKKGIKNVEN